MKLTAKQEAFTNEYMIDNNATASAIRAGYKKKAAYATGAENLKKPQIRMIIDKKLEERAINTGITAKYVIDGIKAIADNGKRESDRIKAYELLGKHLKLFTEKIESTNTNHNEYDYIKNLTDEELQKEIDSYS